MYEKIKENILTQGDFSEVFKKFSQDQVTKMLINGLDRLEIRKSEEAYKIQAEDLSEEEIEKISLLIAMSFAAEKLLSCK